MPAENAAMAEQGASRANGPTPTSRRCRRSSSRWACRSTGAARSRPAIRAITSTSSSMFLDFLQGGPRRPQDSEGQLGPGRPDRARQRAGDRRPRLALRRAGRAARADAVVLQDHRLRRGSARRARHARPLAGQGAADAAQLDRPLGRPAGALRARSETAPDGETSSRSSRRGRTRCSARASWRSRPIIRSRTAAAAKNPALAAFIAECKRSGTAQEAIEKAEKLGFDTGIRAVHPFDPTWTLPVYVANFVLMDYGTGAIFGCPAHDQRDLDFANKYGLGNMPGRLPATAPDPATFVVTDAAYDGDGALINSRFLDGMTIERGQGRGRAAARERDARQPRRSASARSISACATGAFRASAIGAARSRSSIARPAASCRCREQDLPVELPDDVDLRQAGQSARPSSDLEARRLPAMRQAGAARDRHDGHVRRFVLVFRALHRSVDDDRADRPRRWSTTGCRSISISAASSTRSCICSIRASSRAR